MAIYCAMASFRSPQSTVQKVLEGPSPMVSFRSPQSTVQQGKVLEGPSPMVSFRSPQSTVWQGKVLKGLALGPCIGPCAWHHDHIIWSVHESRRFRKVLGVDLRFLI